MGVCVCVCVCVFGGGGGVRGEVGETTGVVKWGNYFLKIDQSWQKDFDCVPQNFQ